MRGALVGTSGSRPALQGHGIGLRALLLSDEAPADGAALMFEGLRPDCVARQWLSPLEV